MVYRTILSQPERRHAKEFSLRSLEGAVDSDTGTRMIFLGVFVVLSFFFQLYAL